MDHTRNESSCVRAEDGPQSPSQASDNKRQGSEKRLARISPNHMAQACRLDLPHFHHHVLHDDVHNTQIHTNCQIRPYLIRLYGAHWFDLDISGFSVLSKTENHARHPRVGLPNYCTSCILPAGLKWWKSL